MNSCILRGTYHTAACSQWYVALVHRIVPFAVLLVRDRAGAARSARSTVDRSVPTLAGEGPVAEVGR